MNRVFTGDNRYWRYLLSLFFIALYLANVSVVSAEDGDEQAADLPEVLFAGVFLRGASAESELNFPYLSEVLLDESTDSSGMKKYAVKREIAEIVEKSIREHREDINGFRLVFRGEKSATVNLALGLLFNNEYILKEKYADGSVLVHLRISAMFTLINYRSNSIIASFPFMFSHDFFVQDEEHIRKHLQDDFRAVLGITADKGERISGARQLGDELHSLVVSGSQDELEVDASLLGMIEDGVLKRLYLPKAYEDEPTSIRIGDIEVADNVIEKLGLKGQRQQEERFKSFVGEVLGSQLSQQYKLSVLPFARTEQGLSALYRQILDGLSYADIRDGETGVFADVLPVYIVTYNLRIVKEKVMTETAYQRGYGFGTFATVKLYEAAGDGDDSIEGGKGAADRFELKNSGDSVSYERIWGVKTKYVTSAVVPRNGYQGFDLEEARRRIVDNSLAEVVSKFGKYKTSKEVIDICTESEL